VLLNSMANWSKLSRAWHKGFLTSDPTSTCIATPSRIRSAVERTLPLLHDNAASVPFVCRYRADVVDPLSTKQVHTLSQYLEKYAALASLRKKILLHLHGGVGVGDPHKNDALVLRVETSISKSELEDVFAPFKPPSKGSLEDRIRAEHPRLVDAVDELWREKSTHQRLFPRSAAVTLLANRIANDVAVMDAAVQFCEACCKIQVRRSPKSAGGTRADGPTGKKATPAVGDMELEKYRAYFEFERSCRSLRDHQVLAIRRGVDQKILTLGFDVDNDRAERIVRGVLPHRHALFRDAVHEAWTRLLRKRCTARLWKQQCRAAEEKSIEVFCDNLYKALLSPPATSAPGVLALDPGFKAGIKCAVLETSGSVLTFETVHFMGGARERGKRQLMDLLQKVQDMGGTAEVQVVLGNGHGTREARELVQEAAEQGGITMAVHLVSEAGASVWSVTDMAGREFPHDKPAAVAAASIGRRYLNPLHELVKIPPRSLGLGMYQHDLPERMLDDKLSATAIDAVAAVGVDINACSREILGKVPSLTAALCDNIIGARPWHRRTDLLQVPRLGVKTFENCAAFIRVTNGDEPLDATLVHPESYDLARFLLQQLQWKLEDPASVDTLVAPEQQREEWREVARLATNKFHCPEERVFTVIEQLLFSITSPDPRLRDDTRSPLKKEIGSSVGSSALPSELLALQDLRRALPVRKITANVRNVVDFGAFVDFGGENDGLLHHKKLGPVSLHSLLVGQEIAVDILGVSDTGRISLGLHGLDFPVEKMDAKRSSTSQQNPPSSKRRRKK